MRNMIKTTFILSISLSFLFACLLSAGDVSAKQQEIIRTEQKKLDKRIAKMKSKADSLFFARSTLTLDEQEKIAKKEIEIIKKLSNVSGFDTVDNEKVYKHICNILRQAPDSKAAMMAHWQIHSYYMHLLLKTDLSMAQDSLESFLTRSGLPEHIIREAYDKLTIISSKEKNWGLAFYYASKYLELEPDHYPLLLVKARALAKLGESVPASKIFRRIIKEAEGTTQAFLASSDLKELESSSNESPQNAQEGCPNKTDFNNPIVSAPDEQDWEEYDTSFFLNSDTAPGLNPGTGSPEAAVIQFYASMIRGDSCYENVIPKKPRSYALIRSLEKVKSWKFLEVKLLKRKKLEGDKYWIALYMKISFKGGTDSGTDEATVTKINGRWLLVDPPI
jgi:hypothetical protein